MTSTILSDRREVTAKTATPTPNRYGTAPILKIKEHQYSALAAAVAAGAKALIQFGKAEQSKRDARADAEWTGYQLYRPQGTRYAAGVVNPVGLRYHCDVTGEGVKRFVANDAEGAVSCPDQAFCDYYNEQARRAGTWFRLESKHAAVMQRRERAAAAGQIAWKGAN